MKNNKVNKYLDLICQLEKHKFLTSDSFDCPDRTFIYLDYSYLKPIRIMNLGDITSEFNIDIYKDCEFREVQRKFENNSYLNDH
jgi:hypothetical protein